MRTKTFLFGLLMRWCPLALVLVAQAAVANELPTHQAQLVRHAAEPRGVSDLLRIAEEKKQSQAELGPLRAFYLKVAGDSHYRGETRALALEFALETARTLGDLGAARADAKALGTVEAWAVAGPFDNDGRAGFDATFPPETQPVDYTVAWPGKEHEAHWRVLPFAPEFGVVDLSSFLSPHKQIVFYGATVITSPRAQTVWVACGASGATKLWVNGAMVRSDPAQHPARFDQSFAAVTLKQGENTLLLKVAGGEAWPSLRVRLGTVGGAPMPSLASSIPKAGARLVDPSARTLERESRVDDALALLSRSVLTTHDASLAEDEAILLASRRPFDVKERTHLEAQKRAVALAPKDPALLIRQSRYEEENANKRRVALETALALSPHDVSAQLALARTALDRGQPFRALPYLEDALGTAPDSLSTGRGGRRGTTLEVELLLARAHEAMGLFPRAIQERRALAERFPKSPDALKQAAFAERRLGRSETAIALLRRALARRWDDSEARNALVQLLLAKGDLPGATKTLDDVAALDPGEVDPLLRAADVLSAHDGGAHGAGAPGGTEVSEANAYYARAREMAPDSAEVYERRGKHLLRRGDTAGALDDFQHALALRPQNPPLRELARAVRPEKSYAAPYLADATQLRQSSDHAASDDAVMLSDVHVTRVFPNGLASRTEQQIVLVQNQRGVEMWRTHGIQYTPGRQELRIERARVIRPDGSIVESHGENDRSLSEPWFGLYYDYRQRVLSFPTLAPGDIVEITTRLDDAGEDNYFADYFGDVVFLQSTIPTTQAAYVLIGPPGRRFYSNTAGAAKVTRTEKAGDAGATVLSWTAQDVPKIVTEPGMPGWSEVATFVHVSTYKDWHQVGEFYWGLVKDQLHVTDEIRKAAQEAVSALPAADEEARIRAVYDYVISQTRYVGLEFGIHGFKPYKVSTILERSFGDCKDKASLMHAMLDALGIESRLALVRMHHLGKIPSEPASLAVFNHAILYVPKFKLFLDGTAEYHGSHELPGDDRGAEALVVDPAGHSDFVTIDAALTSDNATESRFQIALDAAGDAHLTGTTLVRGLGAPDYRRSYESKDTRKSRFEETYSRAFPGLTCTAFDMNDPGQVERDVSTSFAATVPRFAQHALRGLSFTPFGQAPQYVESYAPLSKRDYALVLGYPWRHRFHYEVDLPTTLAQVQLPEDAIAQSRYGNYHLAYHHEGARLIAEGEVVLKADRVEPADYAEFRSFLAGLDAALLRQVKLSETGSERAAR